MMDLETPDPPSTPEPPAAAAPPAGTAPEPPPVAGESVAAAAPDPDEASAIDVQGGKHVPLDALKAARAEAKQAKEQAEQFKQLANQLQGSLATFQHLQQNLPQRQAPDAPAPPTADPALVEYAKSLDYYKTDGTPDLERASKFAALVRQEATKLAGAAVQPLAEQQAQQQSFRNYQQALEMKAPNGLKPSVQTLNWMWQNLPAAYTADPRVAQVLPALAVGLDVLAGNGTALPQAPAAPIAPPVVTEGAGHPPPRGRVNLTDAERAVIEARGMDEGKYSKLTSGFKSGRLNTLED